MKLEKTALLAPMAGVADRAYRKLCRDYGAAGSCSEMISVKGLCYGDTSSAELCVLDPEARPTGIQLFGSDPAYIARAVTLVQPYQPDWIDLNMGCPVRKVVSTGAGSALMRDIPLAQRCVEAAVSASDVPVTVKCRLGWDDESRNAVEFCLAMEDAGAAAVTVHGRTRAQMYNGKADWQAIAEVKKALHVPVVGNGDVHSGEDACALYKETGCDLIMVGRGSRGNPFVFSEICAALRGEVYTPPTLEMRMETMLYHLRMVLQMHTEMTEAAAMKYFRKQAVWYMTGLRGAAQFRAQCTQLQSYADAEALVQAVLRENG